MQKASQAQQSHQLAIKPQLQDAALGPIHDATQTTVSEPIKVERAGRSPKRGATGPHTEAGKQRASCNAIKHGVFSEVTVLPGESAEKYGSLLKELRDTLQPEVGLEELLVEKLASITWRHRRLLLAEGAEIRGSREFLEWDQRNQQRQEAEEFGTRDDDPGYVFGFHPGLIEKIGNPLILERCLELLVGLRREIEADGFDYERDDDLLRKIYGSKSNQRSTLYESYPDCAKVIEESEEEEEEERVECATPEKCKSNFLSEMDDEIRRLRAYEKKSVSIESERRKVEVLRRNIPEPERLDRLLRYEASLERSFDRTLNQLERIQRLRHGQPVAPRIDVNVSTGA
jgi:hypothetical protein